MKNKLINETVEQIVTFMQEYAPYNDLENIKENWQEALDKNPQQCYNDFNEYSTDIDEGSEIETLFEQILESIYDLVLMEDIF